MGNIVVKFTKSPLIKYSTPPQMLIHFSIP